MFQGIGQVIVNQVWRKVLGLPRQAATEDFQLLQVAGATPDTGAVLSGEFKDHHGGTCSRIMPLSWRVASRWNRRHNRHGQNPGQLAQLTRLLGVWLFACRHPILRGAWLAVLAALIWLSRAGDILLLLSLGQFRKAFLEARRPRKG